MKTILANGLPVLLSMPIGNLDALDLCGSTVSLVLGRLFFILSSQKISNAIVTRMMVQLPLFTIATLRGIKTRQHTFYGGSLKSFADSLVESQPESIRNTKVVVTSGRQLSSQCLKPWRGTFSGVYITIDALDESSNREHLLKLLRTTVRHTKLGQIRLLATSRKELDIERALSPLAVELSLSNPYVDKDIRTYVRSRIQEDPKFCRWPESLRSETEVALSEGAKGM